MFRGIAALATIAGWMVLAGSAAAQPAGDPPPASPAPPSPAPQAKDTDAPPWAENVSPEKRRQAAELYERANSDFVSGRHNAALKLYKQALELWDNPLIHYNSAVSLMHLERPLEAHRHLEKAMKWGSRGFESEELFKQAQLQRKLLRAQLGELTVDASEPGATITVDGAAIAAGAPILLAAGSHQLVVTAQGFTTATRTVELRGGTSERVRVTLSLPGDVTVERRFPVWMPWTVAGTGAVVLGLAVFMHTQSSSHFDEFDERFAIECPNGCDPSTISPATRDIEDKAERERTIATASYITGGALLAGGVALIILNRERVVEATEVAPAVTGDTVGVVVRGSF